MTDNLKAFTVKAGAPFPFTVTETDDLNKAAPKPREIVVSGDEFRLLDDPVDNTVPNALRAIIKTLSPELKEHTTRQKKQTRDKD